MVILWGVKDGRVCLPLSYNHLPPSLFVAIVDCFVSISLLGKFRIYCRCLASECRLGSAATAGWEEEWELGWGVGERVGWRVIDGQAESWTGTTLPYNDRHRRNTRCGSPPSIIQSGLMCNFIHLASEAANGFHDVIS